MGGHQDALVGHDAGRDLVEPHWQHPVDRQLQRLSTRQGCHRNVLVKWIVRRVPLVAGFDRGRWDVEAATPDLDLVVTVLRGGVRLVETLKAAVVPLVQAPGVHDGHREVLAVSAHRPGGLDSSPQHRREDDVELETLLFQALSSLDGLLLAVLAQIHVRPTGENVRHVPHALTVTDEDHLVHHGGKVSYWCKRICLRFSEPKMS
mmetsp:Transcript_23149/g.60829  ORF Transcript_23149/g.60829 Transcript_23149/m.60829 type:complete len:205 (-) Transcript_23149:21-635(-)